MKQIGNTSRGHRTSLRQAITLGLLMTVAGLSQAQTARPAQDFDIPAGTLVDALDRFGEQSGLQVAYDLKLLKDKRASAVRGKLSSDAALRQLLQGAGLEVSYLNEKTVIIQKADKSPPPVLPKTQSVVPGKQSDSAPAPTDIAAVTVTGTRIRGGDTASSMVTIDDIQIQEEGFHDLGEVIRSLPQNFSGGQNPGVVNGSAGNLANQNITGGSGLNLRGLGPDATLTLLNGRRMSYGSFVQTVDISAIPVEAVDRIEIVPDGASAIYGSDAVGGVANVILKRDYDGVTVGTRYGGATDGGLITREYTATAGTTWSTGGLIATWKKASGDPIYATQRGYTKNVYDPYTIYPGNDLRSGLFSVHQSFGNNIELHLDALRTEREMTYYYGYSGYYFVATPETTTTLVSPSIEFSLPDDWMLTIGGTWGEDETIYHGSIVRTTGITKTGTVYSNKSRTYEVGAEGPLFSLPGGDVRLAIGAGYRYNDYRQRNLITGSTSADGDESSRFAYAELNLPLIGADQNIFGVRRLSFTAALRGEDYDSFGRVTTPKLGLIYAPNDDFTLKAAWGKSFKAPTLLQRYQTKYAYLYSASYVGGSGYASDATVLIPYGGNPDLNPERARTWSTSLVFHPQVLPALNIEISYFDIDYTDRVVLPISITQALSNSIYAEFINYSPTAEQLAEIISDADIFTNNTVSAYDASKVIAIAEDRYINAARQRIKGVDLSSSYRLDLGPGRLTIRGSGSWLDSSQQSTATMSAYELAGTLFNPAKLNGRVGAVWNQNGFSTSIFLNYTGGVTNTLDDRKSASFTTFDTTLRYDTGDRKDGWSRVVFELSAQNLFNRSPPLYTPTSATAFLYDSTNYSSIGRYLSVAVSKHW